MGRYEDALKRKKKKETEESSVSSRYDIALNKSRAKIDTLDDDYQKLASRVSEAYTTWQDADTMSKLSSDVDEMNRRLTAYNRWAKATNNENSENISKLTARFNGVPNRVKSLSDVYGGYKNSNAFSTALEVAKEKESAKSYRTSDAYDNRIKELESAYGKETTANGKNRIKSSLDALKSMREEFVKNPNSKYETLRDEKDFEELSKYRTGTEGNTWLHKQVNGQYNTSPVQTKNEKTSNRMNDALSRMNKYNKLTDEEKSMYNYLYNTGKYDEAEGYIKNLDDSLRSRANEAVKEGNRERVEDLSPFLQHVSSAVSIIPSMGMNAYNGALDLVEMASYLGGEKGHEALTNNEVFKTLNDLGEQADMGVYHEVTSEGVKERRGTAGYIGYEAVYSALQSLAGVHALGHGYEAIMGLGSAHETFDELSKSGKPTAQVIVQSLASGVLEALWEHLPTDEILSMSKNTTSFRGAIKNMLKLGAEEGLEEFGTEASNIVVDGLVGIISQAIGGENTSKLYGEYKQYLEMGYSEQEAKDLLHKETTQQILMAGVTGALSGALMGASSFIDLNANQKAGKQVVHPEALVEVAKSYSGESDEFEDYYNKLMNNPTTAEKGAIARNLADRVNVSTRNMFSQMANNEDVSDDLVAEVYENKVNLAKALTKTEAEEKRDADKRSNEEIVQEMASKYAEDVQDSFIENYKGQNPYEYQASFNLAYENGRLGLGSNDVIKNMGVLDEDSVTKVYEAGLKSRSNIEAKLNEVTKGFSRKHFKAGTFDDSAIDYSKLTKSQREGVALAHVMSDKLGVNITMYQTTAEQQKKHVANGFYDPSTNTIHIDVNAGLGGAKVQEAIIFPTISHEITHWAKTKALDLYNNLSDSIFNALQSVDGVSAEARINKEIARMKSKEHKDATVDDARDEIVARACEDMLKNSKTMDKYLKKMDEKEITTFKEEVKKVFDSIAKFFHDLAQAFTSNEYEAKTLLKMEGNIKDLQKQWDKMLDKAIQTNKAGKTDIEIRSLTKEDAEILAKAGIQYDADTESFSSDVMNDWRSLEDEELSTSEYLNNRDKVAEVMAKQMSKLNGTTMEEEIDRAKDFINNLVVTSLFYKAHLDTLDYVPSEGRSMFVSNVEYGGSIDANTECAKRRVFTGTFEAIQKILGNRVITANEVLEIRNMLLDRDIQATCGCCYVEGSRVHMGEYNEVFLKKYKATNPPYMPTMYEVNTPDGNEELRLNHPEVYEALEYFYNHYGQINEAETNAIAEAKKQGKKVPKNLFASQQKPKMYTLRTNYKGEIRDKFTDDNGEINEADVNEKNTNGGIRFQSFSDFEIVHTLDIMQAIADCSYVGLAGQAYTKVEAFARIFGDTNLKINLSLITKGLDKNGNLIFDDREGINHDVAFDLRDAHSKNVGTVLVVFNKAQLNSALKDPRIDYVLPFHRSQWTKAQYATIGLPKDTYDFTNYQNEGFIKLKGGKYLVPHYGAKGGILKRPNNFMPNEYWDYSKSGRENAEKYLQMCAEDGRKPKFAFLLVDNGDYTYSLPEGEIGDNYFKLLIDFKMYDNKGNGSPQLPMIPQFDMKATMELLGEYESGHNSFPVAQEVVDEFVKGKTPVKYSSREETRLLNEYDEALKAYESADSEAKRINNEARLASIVKDYALAKGFTYFGFHGTPADRFNEFDRERVGRMGTDQWGAGYYFASDKNVSRQYGRTVFDVAIKMDNPLVLHSDMRTPNFIDAGEDVKLTPQQTYEVIKRHPELDRVLGDYFAEWWDEGTKDWMIRDLATKYDYSNIGYLDSDLFADYPNELHEILRDVVGYDGVVVDFDQSPVRYYVPWFNNNIKSIEAIERDNDGNIIPLNERFDDTKTDIRYSSRDLGYHAGDLGKAEWLSQQSTGRGTGHFGTGTYFVGDEKEINIGGYKERPHHAVSFEGYNLFKPHNYKEGMNLHDFLQMLESGINESWIDRLERNEINAIDRFYSRDVDDYKKFADEHGIEYMSKDEYLEDAGYYNISDDGADFTGQELNDDAPDISLEEMFNGKYHKDSDFHDVVYHVSREELDSDYEDYIKNTVVEYIEEENTEYHALDLALLKVKFENGFDDWANGLRAVAEYQKKYKNGAYQLHMDSYATVFMKALGFEGVDVRGIEGLDNTAYGSVIYDFNPASVFYQDRNLDYDIADADGSVERILTENRLLAQDLNILNTLAQKSYMAVSDSYASTLAKKVAEKYGSKVDTNELAKDIRRYFKVMLKGNVDVVDLFNLGGEIATKVLDNSDKFSELKTDSVADYIKSEMKRAVIMDIYNPMWNGVKLPNTDAKAKIDKANENMQKKLEDERKKHNDRLKEVRQHYEEKRGEDKAKITKHYKELLKKTRDELKDKYKTKAQETIKNKIDKMNEAEARKNAMSKVMKNLNDLADMMKKNDKKKHVNEALKPIVADILKMVNDDTFNNTQKNTTSLVKVFKKLSDIVENDYKSADNTVDKLFEQFDDTFKETIADYVKVLESMQEAIKGKPLNIKDMNAQELEQLADILMFVKSSVRNVNRMFGNARRQYVEDEQRAWRDDMANLTRHTFKNKDVNKMVNNVANFFDYSMALPYYAFNRLGNSAHEMFERIMDGWDKFAIMSSDIIKELHEFYKDPKNNITKKERTSWQTDKIEVETKNKYGQDISFTATPAQLMSLYCLSKRESAKKHLESDEGGFRIGDSKVDMMKTAKYVMDVDTIQKTCLKYLNDKQILVANHLQNMMSTKGSEWGNAVTLERWGIRCFEEKNYFPMQTVASSKTDEEQMNRSTSIFRLLNASFTKGLLKNAKNGLEIGDIFEVYAHHMEDMAKYNALALPTLDLFRVWNYQEESDTVVKNAIHDAFGDGMNNYIFKFLKDLNGSASGGSDYLDGVAKTLIRNYKISAVGGNLRVAFLQATAYTRAGYVIPHKYLAMSLKDVIHAEEYSKECIKNCGIARWKDLGFFNTNISRSLEEKIVDNGGVVEKAREIATIGAEKGDRWTWGMIYHACELEAQDMGLRGDDALEYVKKRFREIVYQTQVVDSTMTRTQAMRDTSTMVQMITAFMSEAMMSFNMLTQGFYDYQIAKQKYGKGVAWKQNKGNIINAFGTFLLTTMFASLVGAFPDLLRDEDEKMSWENYFKLVGDNFFQDALGMIPIAKDIISLAKGYSLTRMDEQFMASFQSAFKQWFNGEFNYKDIYSTAKALSQTTGIPVSNVIRGFKTIFDRVMEMYDKSVGDVYPSMRIK